MNINPDDLHKDLQYICSELDTPFTCSKAKNWYHGFVRVEFQHPLYAKRTYNFYLLEDEYTPDELVANLFDGWDYLFNDHYWDEPYYEEDIYR